MLIEPYQIDRAFGSADYNIDLFVNSDKLSGSENPPNAAIVQSSSDDSSSQGSNSDSSSESADVQMSERQLEVPESVIRRFFTNQQAL